MSERIHAWVWSSHPSGCCLQAEALLLAPAGWGALQKPERTSNRLGRRSLLTAGDKVSSDLGQMHTIVPERRVRLEGISLEAVVGIRAAGRG